MSASRLSTGIVGLANIGKSTLFQAITNSKLGNPANYPFATIDPQEARVIIPSPELNHLQTVYKSKKAVPATLTIWDIAGLTRNASSGKGLGNKFLNDIRSVDFLLHVMRGFKTDDVTHLEGGVDPVRDVEIVQDELVLKDLEFLESAKDRLNRLLKNRHKNSQRELEWHSAKRELELLQSLEEHLYEGQKIIHLVKDWTLNDRKAVAKYNFLSMKPTLHLLNVSPSDYIKSMVSDKYTVEFVKPLESWLSEHSPNEELILFSADFETHYNNYRNNNDVQGFSKYCSDAIGTKGFSHQIDSVLPQIISKMRQMLGLISFYTCGPEEVRQWLIRDGTAAPEAAGVIHTDLQKTFIYAEVTPYDEVKHSSKPLVKRAGKQYVMQDNDIVHFKATASKTR